MVAGDYLWEMNLNARSPRQLAARTDSQTLHQLLDGGFMKAGIHLDRWG